MSSKSITRRDFLKGAAAGALGLAAVSLTGCANDAPSAAKGIYTPGTYSAVVKGYSSYMTVELTFSADKITDCAIAASGETESIGKAAADELAKLIVEKQSADVETAATADITIPALKKAVNNCIAQAQGLAEALIENSGADSEDWLGEAPEIADSQIASTHDTDLLIIGAGNGGMMAAATATDAKMNFMICEQNETLGDTRHWIGALDTEAMKKAGVTVQKDRLLNEIARYASYKCDMEVIKMWMNNSAEMISYLESLGLTASVNIAHDNHVGGNNMEYYVPSIWHTVNAPEGSEFAASMGCEAMAFWKSIFRI